MHEKGKDSTAFQIYGSAIKQFMDITISLTIQRREKKYQKAKAKSRNVLFEERFLYAFDFVFKP